MAYRIGPPVSARPQFKKPANSTGTIPTELFDGLFGCDFTAAQGGQTAFFPVSSVKFGLSFDIVQHKYWGVDGARVETTGRAPLEFDVEIPFVNGIVPAGDEWWGTLGKPLYPDRYYDLLRAIGNGRAGTFTHPELGEIFCRCVSMDTTHAGETRDGVIVTAKWIESREAPNDKGLVATKKSHIETAKMAAASLDANKDDLLSKLPELPQDDFSFDDAMNKLTGLVDTATETVSLLVAKPAQILNRVKQVTDALGRSRATFEALAWKQKEAASRLEDSINAIGKPGSTKTKVESGQVVHVPIDKPTSRWVTPDSMTLSQVCVEIGKVAGQCPDPKELQELNPVFISRTRVGPQTVVFYYP